MESVSEMRVEVLQGTDRRWVVPVFPDTEVMALAAALPCAAPTARVLLARGYGAAEASRFLSLDGPGTECQLDDIDIACDRVLDAVERGERVFIHGDYDVDGITSAFVLSYTLSQLGNVPEVFLPHRTIDGYGVSRRGVDRALASGASLFIAADCGATAGDLFQQLKAGGCDSLVIDHHVQEGVIEGTVAVLNPGKPGSTCRDRDLAAVGVAYVLARRLFQRTGRAFPPLLHAVAAVGTVADVAPIRGENRRIVRLGLQALAACDNPGLGALIQRACPNPSRLRTSHIAFQIGPRLNAAGRLDHPDKAFRVLTETDPTVLHALIEGLERLNRQRQEIEETILQEALTLVDPSAAALVVAGDAWPRGVIGIVASRLVDRFHRPALVVTLQDGMAFGSARSVPGVNIVGCLKSCAAHLVAFGGHEGAAGFSLHPDRIPEFREAVDRIVRELGVPPVAEIRLDAELSSGELRFETVDDMARLEPYGHGNPEPLFLLRSVIVPRVPRAIGEKGIRFGVVAGNRPISAVAWRKPGWRVPVGTPIDVAVRLQYHEYQGLKELQLQVEDFRDAG